jgi:HEAT repeat protein
MAGSSHENETLKTALAQLRSDDVLVQNEGVASVIQLGAEAVPALLPFLEDGSATRRSQVMYALAQIAEPGTAEAFQRGLGDPDERVRAYAAVGLARIGYPNAVMACLQTLNDAPDEAHLDMTPAVQALGEIGMSVVPALLDLLMNEDEFTRLHAQRALELILNRRHGFQPGQGFPIPEAEEQMRTEWQANGAYDYAADAATRAASVAKWRRWLETTKE